MPLAWRRDLPVCSISQPRSWKPAGPKGAFCITRATGSINFDILTLNWGIR